MEITVDYLKDKVHEQYLKLQELRKSYDELTKSALRLHEMVKEKQQRIDKAIRMLNELANLYDDNYTVSDKTKDIIRILEGGDKE